MRKNGRTWALGAAVLVLTAGGWVSYQKIFTEGLDRLPAAVCDGSVQRDTVIRVLPDSRSAQEGAKAHGTGDSFLFGCHIYAGDDSILSGDVQIEDSSQKTWAKYYKSYAGKSKETPEQASSHGIDALARKEYASVYVPCVPKGKEADEATQAYALVAEVRVIGESRTTGRDLHQALSDFAYQLTRHAYELAGCKESVDFPDELPRFENG
ncbi:hypothetical protein [Streptomyces antibioticus]|uniref:Uncharacterized protein n=1 Tax=Streptomyces antibioticus TaxID=1890 RepID=A0AAE6YCN5_STRAT|nr:hypothetical protein [Streptomyces antibioticus]QIT46394.1 hypothetical protein HCX60_25085 [Streptomyces antibioticus]